MSPQNQGGWQPLPPSGDYDPEATGFLQMPAGGWDGDDPLAAPGHGFTPPPIAPAAADPADTGVFRLPDLSTPPAAEHTGTWQIAGGEATHPADGEGSRTQGQISAWTRVAGAETAAEVAPPVSDGSGLFGEPVQAPPPSEGAAMRRGLSAGLGALGAQPDPASAAPAAQPDPAVGAHQAAAPEETAEWRFPFEEAQATAEQGTGQWTAGGEAAAGAQWPAPSAVDDESGEYPLGGSDEHAPAAPEEPAAEGHDAAAETPEAPVADGMPDEHPRISYVLRVNEADRPVTDAWIGESLLYVLRERLGLAGAKDGCSQGECGACNVKVDGRLVASCLVPAATAAGAEIRTSEGLAKDGLPSDVQRALAASGAVQCGFCIPGLAMTVHDLLEGNHAPNERETRQALCGNLCRCTGYQGVLSAVKDVIAQRTGPQQDEPAAHIPQQAGPRGQE
ncbi:(2Fe-2S)-binding protein [Streptomyces sp. NPDC051940]|uniref:(2Fe-2S)-binding protein n=1 Tax=Streptomyces sp. NPDC051940 TaxID=3155675 RepID=UPI00342B60C3